MTTYLTPSAAARYVVQIRGYTLGQARRWLHRRGLLHYTRSGVVVVREALMDALESGALWGDG